MIRKTRDAEAAKQWLRVMEALLLSEGGEDRLERYSGLAEELVVLEKELKP